MRERKSRRAASSVYGADAFPAYALPYAVRRKALVDLVLEEARRRGRGHELAVHFGRDAAVGEQPAVAEFDFENLRLGVVADRADLARIDALALHGHSIVMVIASPKLTVQAPSARSPAADSASR